MSVPRVVALGVDAADANLVRRWAGEGHLPTFATLLETSLVAPIATPVGVLEGGIYNVGGGPDNQLSLLELLDLLSARTGRTITPAFADWRPGDQKVFVSDIAKAKRDFGWFPKVSATSGVDRLADWVLQEKALLASVLG